MIELITLATGIWVFFVALVALAAAIGSTIMYICVFLIILGVACIAPEGLAVLIGVIAVVFAYEAIRVYLWERKYHA